jgi:transcriptional regulator with GAF, ATPase, and Fis domain
MALVAFSPSRHGAHADPQPIERLAIRLSSRFATLESDDVGETLERALGEIGVAFAVDECSFIALGERTGATVVHTWSASPGPSFCTEHVLGIPRLLERLAANTVVTTTPTADDTGGHGSDNANYRGMASRLAVPVALGTRVPFGLIVGSRDRLAEWPAHVIERLRFIGEIVGAGLDRIQHDGSGVARTERESSGDVSGGDVARVPAWPGNQSDADQIVGGSTSLRVAMTRLAQVAPIDATVLLLGETGTGKELFARALHRHSRRRDRTLVRVNCAALPATLIESELFGHERGAFTGAVAMRQGRFELADGGTIFLDEIGDLVPELQAKLLRVLQEGEFERVGSSKSRRVNVRLIAATHVDLEKAVAEGRFRADLYYRLSVFPITLPPLRDRAGDIAQLVWFFIRRHERAFGRRIAHVPADVMQTLQNHDWPGNIRELENVVERAMIRSTGDTLRLDGPLCTDTRGRLLSGYDTLDAVQRFHIENVLRECGGRINGANNAAVRLGVHPNTLRFRIKKLGVRVPGRGLQPSIPPNGATSG